MTIVCAACGVLLVLFMLVEAFEAMVLPRQVTRPFRLTRTFYRALWSVWRAVADRLPVGRRRDTFYSILGPLSLLLLFVAWGSGLVLGFALLHWSVTPMPSFPDALYFSGVTFTTLGYGDITPQGPLGRVLAVVEAAVGFGFVAVVIGYLPTLYQAFGRRETLIALLDARAGSPPAAGRLLLRLPPIGKTGAALERFMEEGERWSAELLESHLSFPVLSYYRSQHDNQSWLAALVCILDASALLLTVVDGVDRRLVRLAYAMARHAIVDLALVMRRGPQAAAADRLPEARLCELAQELRKLGVSVRDDGEALAELARLRGLYEPFAVALSHHFRLRVLDVWPADERPDNWQTSAWMRRACPIQSLGMPSRDDHFD
jgi:hypothetical protein